MDESARRMTRDKMASALRSGAKGWDWWRLLPIFWIQNTRTCVYWDSILNKALTLFGVSNVTSHECRVGPFRVWISNWPYAYGSDRDDGHESLPRVKTRKRLRQAIISARLADAQRKIEIALEQQDTSERQYSMTVGSTSHVITVTI